MQKNDNAIPPRSDYAPNAWRQYTVEELEWWVKLLRKRATHRTDEAKRVKDLYDADVYEKMLEQARAA